MHAVVQLSDAGVIDRIDTLIEKEREAILLYQRNASVAADPAIRNVFIMLAEKRYEYFGQLYGELENLRSENEITAQINDMFQ